MTFSNNDMFWVKRRFGFSLLRRAVSVLPSIYIPLRRRRHPLSVVSKNTDLVIEGFPRCGNTWTEALIREASNDTLVLAHHSHAVAHIKYATSRGVPSIILYRNPDDAVASLLEYYDNRLDPGSAFLDYTHFYHFALELKGPLVRFYSFEHVTQRAEDFVADVASAFNLQFSNDEITKETVFARMDEKAKRVQGASGGVSLSRPDINPYKDDSRRRTAEASIREASVVQQRGLAHEVYQKLTSDLA